jgi:hypothetical protein
MLTDQGGVMAKDAVAARRQQRLKVDQHAGAGRVRSRAAMAEQPRSA